jgi:hypothetical protein
MSLEDIGAIERRWAETADQSTLVMCESMTLAVILSCESLLGIIAIGYRALFGTLLLVCQEMRLHVSEAFMTFGADGLFPRLIWARRRLHVFDNILVGCAEASRFGRFPRVRALD